MKTFVLVLGIVFFATLVHEGVHVVQVLANFDAVAPAAFCVGGLHADEYVPFAWVEWRAVNEPAAKNFVDNRLMWEAQAYAVFASIIGALFYFFRREF